MKEMLERLKSIESEAISGTDAAAGMSELESVRVKYLGKKSELSSMMKEMSMMTPDDRQSFGAVANGVRGAIEEAVAKRRLSLESLELANRYEDEALDVTMPGSEFRLGRRHPMTIVLDELKDIFIGMGFTIAEGPEVETDYYNFEALNIPKDHPARDTQDTFYISDEMLLRTQTSPVQIRTMEKTSPPIRIIAPGRVYRTDTVDATHSPVFHQIEGLVVDKGITMADLKGTLDRFAKRLYGENAKTRFRPHHFQFTEPSCEMDMRCFACEGEGCPLCKGEGYIEILGGGMVHPKVLSICGIDPEVYSGFAFGIGLERITLRRFEIDDIRLLFENDLRFLRQF